MEHALVIDASSDVVVSSVTFEHAAWDQVNSNGNGYVPVQAGFYPFWSHQSPIKSMVHINASTNVRLENCTVRHGGGSGVWVAGGSHHVAIEGTAVADMSGGGIYLGDVHVWEPDTPVEQQDRGLQVHRTAVAQVGVEYWGGVGIFGGYLADSVLSSSTVTNASYSAVSLGWGWSSHATTGTWARNNTVTRCHLDRFLGTTVDGGGVYHLGPTPGTSITRNLFTRQMQTGDGHGGALYLDDGSAWTSWTSNVVANLTQPQGTRWLFAWTDRDIGDVAEGNWVDNPVYEVLWRVSNGTLANNTVVDRGKGEQWPAEAMEVIQEAGAPAEVLARAHASVFGF